MSKKFFGHNWSKSQCYQVQLLTCRDLSVFLYEFGVHSIDSSRMIGNLCEVSNSTGYFSNSSGPFVTNLVVGCPRFITLHTKCTGSKVVAVIGIDHQACNLLVRINLGACLCGSITAFRNTRESIYIYMMLSLYDCSDLQSIGLLLWHFPFSPSVQPASQGSLLKRIPLIPPPPFPFRFKAWRGPIVGLPT